MDPLVSVVVPTRARPHLLDVTLEAYRRQTYARRELIVIDDGDPRVDPEAVAGVGGQLVRLDERISLGGKENLGIGLARGTLIQRMDDDDYYAPNFMEHMVEAYFEWRRQLCRPTVLSVAWQLFLDVRRWELRRCPDTLMAGNTFLFSRQDWEDSPYRPLRFGDDWWFARDLAALRGDSVPVPVDLEMIQVRHGRNSWRILAGEFVGVAMRGWPMYPDPPEAVLPSWALAVYRKLREDMRRPE